MKKDIQIEVINKIRKIRQGKNISQAVLSEILGLNSYGTIGNIESLNYRHKYTLKQLYILSSYFNIRFESLFLSDDELNLDKDNLLKNLIKKIVDYDS